jgi:hypothetical protein
MILVMKNLVVNILTLFAMIMIIARMILVIKVLVVFILILFVMIKTHVPMMDVRRIMDAISTKFHAMIMMLVLLMIAIVKLVVHMKK